jgi:ubiquitin C-terminal hydrolase
VKRRIWRLPQNLIVILKRFEHDGTNPVKRHNDFEADPVQKFSKWFSEKSPETSKTADYALQSVVDHHGSANGGHYVAQVKSPITGKWNVYDDENVSTMKDGSQVYLGRPSYILFYRKQ